MPTSREYVMDLRIRSSAPFAFVITSSKCLFFLQPGTFLLKTLQSLNRKFSNHWEIHVGRENAHIAGNEARFEKCSYFLERELFHHQLGMF